VWQCSVAISELCWWRLKQESLKQEVSTRWNSTLTMLKSVEEVYDEVHHIVEHRGEIYCMAGINRKLLLELISLLAVFNSR